MEPRLSSKKKVFQPRLTSTKLSARRKFEALRRSTAQADPLLSWNGSVAVRPNHTPARASSINTFQFVVPRDSSSGGFFFRITRDNKRKKEFSRKFSHLDRIRGVDEEGHVIIATGSIMRPIGWAMACALLASTFPKSASLLASVEEESVGGVVAAYRRPTRRGELTKLLPISKDTAQDAHRLERFLDDERGQRRRRSVQGKKVLNSTSYSNIYDSNKNDNIRIVSSHSWTGSRVIISRRMFRRDEKGGSNVRP